MQALLLPGPGQEPVLTESIADAPGFSSLAVDLHVARADLEGFVESRGLCRGWGHERQDLEHVGHCLEGWFPPTHLAGPGIVC